MPSVLRQFSPWVDRRNRSPMAELLEGIRTQGNGVQVLGGLAVIRAAFDRRAKPPEALHWMNGVAFEDDGMVTVATHTFIGSGYRTECGDDTCGAAIIDSSRRGGDRLVEGRGAILDLDSAESALQRIRTDIAERSGDPLTSYLSTVALMQFERMEHDFDGQSLVLGTAVRRMLNNANGFPAYYDEALAA